MQVIMNSYEMLLLLAVVLAVIVACLRRRLLTGIFCGAVAAACTLSLLTDMAVGMTLVWFGVIWLVLMALAFGFLWVCCALVDMDKPQEEDSPFYRGMMQLYIGALVTLVGVRIHTEGLEKLPKEGRFLLVCNHLFLADPGVLLHVFPGSQLAFVTKKENQSMFIVGPIMHKILCQSIDRENDRAALKTILNCIRLIKEDKVSIGVFPEGYTSKDGKLHHFRSGVFKIAQKTGVPVVVCTIQNTRQIFKNLAKLKKTDVPLHLVEVIPPEEVSRLSTVELSDRVYECMIADLGEEFREEL